MPLPPHASDAELVAQVAAGDHAAVDRLWGRHADAVHDHLARWTGDAELAAAATVAAFTGLLDDARDGTAPTAVRPGLLRTARSHATQVLAAGDREGPAVPAAVLASSGVASTTPAAAAAAWSAAAALDPPWFSVLDLTVRQGCSAADLSVVLGQPEAAVADLVTGMQQRVDAATRTAYAALAPVRAPVSARSAVTMAAMRTLGAPPMLSRTVGLRVLGALGAVAVLVLGIGLADTLRDDDVAPTSGPATVAAEPVPSPTPEVTPTPTPTLDALASPSAVPMASPEPTVPPPSPSPTPAPTATTAVLTVTIDDPPSGAAFAATTQDGQGRPAAVVPVVATVDGASDEASIIWTSDLAPERDLLRAETGDLLLWLPDPCTSADHVVTATVTDPVDGRTAAASITVPVLETCEEPLTVRIDEPGPDTTITAVPNADGSYTATFDMAASAEGTGLEWLWSTDTGDLRGDLAERSGTLELVLQSCPDASDPPVLRVLVTRAADDADAEASTELRIACPIG